MNKSITVYLLSYNEKFLLPQINKWWRDRFNKVNFVLYDNDSNDGTPKMATELGWKVFTFKTEGMSDYVQMDIKNKCWKNCETKWAWISDFDEVPLFTQKELDKLDPKYSAVRMNGYEFIDTAYTIEEAQYAIQTDGYSKMTLVQPSKLIETNYGAGAHKCNPVFKEGELGEKILDLGHMKWFNPSHALNRAFLLGARQSEDNKKRNWSFHFALPLEEHLNYYKTHFANRIKVR